MRIKHGRQLELPPPRTWGGRRAGAGRKPAAGRRRNVPHRTRPGHKARHPVHVTLRARPDVASLRSSRVFPAVRDALAAATKPWFRVLQFSVQRDHVHLVAEGDDRTALSRGAQGLVIRTAKAINRVLGRRGAVWADRNHRRALTTPREVRNGLVYVLQNWRKHGLSAHGLDPCSSAAWFDGWRAPVPPRHPPGLSPLAAPRTWLATNGWRRLGLIATSETPAATRA